MEKRTFRRGGYTLINLVVSGALCASPAMAESDLIYDSLSAWNGKKVYLSPARHSDAGGRGECTGSSGMGSLNENTAAYRYAYYAASGNYIGSSTSTDALRNLRTRGYKVRIAFDRGLRLSGRFSVSRRTPGSGSSMRTSGSLMRTPRTGRRQHGTHRTCAAHHPD